MLQLVLIYSFNQPKTFFTTSLIPLCCCADLDNYVDTCGNNNKTCML